MMTGPGYWQYETSGVLRPAIERYLTGGTMTPDQIAAMRGYLRQWIDAPVWGDAPTITELRAGINSLTSRDAINAWLDVAFEAGIDPL